MTSANAKDVGVNFRSTFMVLLLLLTVFSPLLFNQNYETKLIQENDEIAFTNNNEQWNPIEQPWGQYSRTPTHNGTMPPHGPDGGPGQGNVSDVTEFGIIDSPVINWAVDDDDGYGSDLYGSIIGDFSNSITSTNAARERCGDGELFAVIVSSDTTSSKLSIVTGDDAKTAWEVDLGLTEDIRSTPMLLDVNSDGRLEILLVYDTSSSLEVELWSPELDCSESGWQKSGHSNEKMWSMSNSNYRIGIQSPHFPTRNSDHKSVTQPLLADLKLDGGPELVLAVVNENTNDPTVVSLSLTTSTPTDFDWEVVLDRGTHPSDPSWGALDNSNTAVVLTTIDSNSGNMWIWRIDGATGSLDWERVAISGTDSDQDSPRLRLPGPVIVQLDSDAAPEMILTIPTDSNGRTPGNGAKFMAMEMTSTTEIFDFRTPNGYSDSQPLPIDTDGDDIHDRLCWVTWYSESSVNFNRKGMAGCHDISSTNPIKEWSKDMQRGSGNDNDEIAVSPPIWMDIDGDEFYELIVPFGKRLWAFNGEDGSSSAISSGWSSPLSMPHRVWSAPAVADMDGDGTLDILIGDTLVSQQISDFAPLSDGRGISFNPNQPDPGNLVTVTGQFSNIGTMDNEDDLDVVILQNGNEIARERFDDVKPVAPSGEGGPYTFSVDITAELGIHEFEMILDINGNLSEAREDNNREVSQLTVVEPYVASVDIPIETPRVVPGTSESVSITLTAIGSRTESWTLNWDDQNLPDGWNFNLMSNQNINPILIPGNPVDVDFSIGIPSDALGDENSFVDLSLTLDIDTNISSTVRLPIEVLRTRGISVVGPGGLPTSDGFGKPGNTATAWLMVENLGNAYESTTSIDWSAPSWGGNPKLYNAAGDEVFMINLAPNEKRELFVNLETPSGLLPGSTTSTTMTMCIGSGEDLMCEDLVVNFTASGVTVENIHTRTLPNQSLAWELNADLPSSGELKWNLVSAQMIQNGWIWSVDGDLSINGSVLEITGTADQSVSGNIYLDLPVNAIPKRHVFSTTADGIADHDIDFSLHVLQVYRTKATVVEPIPDSPNEPISLFVEVTNQIQLRLENPGNGQDDFILNADTIYDETMSSPPVVQFNIAIPQKTLGALATTTLSVDVILSEDTPALEPFLLRFTWKSLGNESVFSEVDLLVQAEPDHNWELEFEDGSNHLVEPSQELSLNFTAKNIGNAIDTLIIKPKFAVEFFEQDSSLWYANEITKSNISVNQTVDLILNFTVPYNAWNGTTASLDLELFSDTLLISNYNLNFTVSHISGWRLNLSETNLVVEPNGGNLTLNVEHLGNKATEPWFSKAGSGWNISYPDSGATVQPFGNSNVTIFVTPPENAIAGEVGIIKLRISDGDGSGEVIQEVPVRVGSAPEISLASTGNWMINSDGGMPTAWVENLGNDIATIEVQLVGLPNDWTVNAPSTIVIAPGQVLGLPFDIVPPTSWDGQAFVVNFEIEHPILGVSTMPITVENSSFSFASSPVLSGISDRNMTINYNGDIELIGQDNSVDFTQNSDSISFVIPTSRMNFTLIDSQDSSLEYVVHLDGKMLPEVSADCGLEKNSFENLGLSPISGKVGQCQIFASAQETVRGTIFLISNSGIQVPISDSIVTIGASKNETIDVNLSSWTTNAGTVELTLMFIDNYGRIISEDEITVVARSNGWNIGIQNFNANGDIKIDISRTEYDRLIGVTCKLTISSENSNWEETLVVDIGGLNYAPKLEIDPGDAISDGEKLTAEVSCASPYDVDDNPEDDFSTTVYSKSSVVAVQMSDVFVALGVSLVLVAVAFFAGLLQVKDEKIVSKDDLTKAKVVTEIKQIEEIEEDEDIDDFSLEFDQDLEEKVNDVIDVDEEDVETSVSEEIVQEMDNSASGRLASLRDELDEDNVIEKRPLKDRMDDFFNS